MTDRNIARICAGIPAINSTLLWRIDFLVGDAVVLLELPQESGTRSTLILRDIEMNRARHAARADQVGCPADFTPEGGLSGDRETATAQATAECLRREGISEVIADRSLPMIFAEFLNQAGIHVTCDPDMWVAQRRQKTSEEVEHLQSQFVPFWIKNNAAWWSQQLIDDSDFVAGLEYLIQNEIITIQDDQVISSYSSNEIPVWIKNNAGWWSEDLITEKEFIDGLQWLISNGIIQVTET